MQEKTRESLRKAFFEAFFVVFGVILALGANEWRQNAAAERHAEEAMANIRAELAANRELVVESEAYHMDRVMFLTERMKAGEIATPNDFNRGFVYAAQITDTAWEVAKETGAVSNMDYDEVLTLSAIYSAQERYQKQAQTIGNMIYGDILHDGIEAIPAKPKNLMSIIYTFVYRERQLLAEYDEVLGAAIE